MGTVQLDNAVCQYRRWCISGRLLGKKCHNFDHGKTCFAICPSDDGRQKINNICSPTVRHRQSRNSHTFTIQGIVTTELCGSIELLIDEWYEASSIQNHRRRVLFDVTVSTFTSSTWRTLFRRPPSAGSFLIAT